MLRQFVGSFPEEGLTLRSAPPQRKEPERASRERDLGTDETMHPVPVDREHVAEQRDSPLGRGPGRFFGVKVNSSR